MLHRFAVAIGAGCAAALLFAVSARASRSGDGARLSRAVADHDRDARLGARRRRDRAGRFRSRRWRSSPSRCRRCCSPLRSRSPAWALAAFAITPIARYFRAARSPAAPAHASVGAVVTLAALFGMLGSAAVLTTLIVRLWRLSRGRAPGRRGRRRALPRERFRRRAGEASGARFRRGAGAIRARRRSPPRRS